MEYTENLGLNIVSDTTMLFPEFVEALNENFQTIDSAFGTIISKLLILNGSESDE